jgi:putative heme-binding domain-containing protein
MESILQPSKEIGPLYVPWRVVTVDGRTLTGLKLDAPGVGDSVRFQGADGLVFEIPLKEIEQQEPVQQSIMPTGLEEIVSLQELRDLTAFLIGQKP